MSIEQGKKNEWILTAHSYQIADTGDYDGYYEIHRGKISFQTKYDEDGAREELQEIVDTLNRASSLSRVEGERDELKRENQEMREVLGEWYMREFAGNARTLPMAIKGRSVGYDPFEERIVALIEGRGVGRVQELKKLLRKALNCIGDGFPVVDEIRKALN